MIVLSHNQTGNIFQRSAFNFIVSGEEADVAVHMGAQVVQMQNGRYQYIKDNDAAAPDCDLSMDSKEWLDVLIDGKPLKVSVEDGEITILATNEETGKEYGGDEWQNVGIDIDPIPIT